ncbi:MAG: DUF86 domain-containing protein [Prolixibacteraceae bacterium]|jgi:uncharacterized protein with HEPN domain|nr:DUF86 domain-containing protein [Prolixibacteraceae bacterium]MBT6006636.1 DUF86 domain-containing protein [Prolixibacteraceae bacterium]MBT6766605.1 DUF86 domain-containing protein [Prolixibacteraceae bacterium]MBT7000333.1 DUF86 domain-containing protein [Prolixibacteraceae bacterium]MBT7395421.1 DUF86 domain-containing protein [Prolixibacteraceae bacterium]
MTVQSKKYLDDILFAIESIEEFIVDINSFAEYTNDKKTRSAVERQMGIIGEAANKYDKLNLKKPLKNLKQIIGLRNRIIHADDSIDDAIIWAIIKNYLSPLKKEVQQKISK